MLEFRDVTVFLGGVRILRNVNFHVNQADTVAMIGPNGAGKTTALRSVMGFTRMTGEILFDGRELSTIAPARRPGLGIGYAHEDRRLFSAFTVEENIVMPGQVAKFSTAELAHKLDRVYEILPELREMARRPAGSVSGGQGKMVALGRALMIGSRLIMLDEPFQGLAPALARRYSEALRALRDQDREVTLIITESNPKLLRKFADRALVLERGEVREGSLSDGKDAA
ncbi:MAG: ATP-binding cassette domain-containing protein [Rhodobiaceae bacterium]|nr:ATP-binding cassette domain-containing protein [Rhodobiaceae bacterium]MCC0054051.1 ATP-binding cassette domain-containing protein [Rhodobiaceae bacterium]